MATSIASSPSVLSTAKSSTRLAAIDALRGFVMALMLVDHMRETIYLHAQVSDPVDASTVEPALFFTRLTATLCAPVFIALTGLSAWLYGQNKSKADVAAFLLKRGLFLIVLELTVINFAWTGQLPPEKVYLQVIWCIGLCMTALAGLIYLPRWAQMGVAVSLIAGHHLLGPIAFAPGDSLYIPWAILHDRSWIALADTMQARTSYPILPWIGIIVLGYLCGPLFKKDATPSEQSARLISAGIGLIAAFLALRWVNVYGDFPWEVQDTSVRSVIAFLSLTKYPPSLLFSLSTLGVGALLLAWLIRNPDHPIERFFAPFGAAPLFFYILHLYVLKLCYLALVALFGTNKGAYFGVDDVWMIWAASALSLAVLYPPTIWFARLKQRRRDLPFLRYL
ncbi:MAG: heparan-alpha-glucosaminide N-acetyltransferase domain-containing protein [Pseudomonadota bacterium]